MHPVVESQSRSIKRFGSTHVLRGISFLWTRARWWP